MRTSNLATLTDVAGRLEALEATKRDFRTASTALSVPSGGNVLTVGDMGDFPIRDTAHAQIAGRLKIPKVYYDKMRETAPELLAENVNHWFARPDESTRFLVRTIEGDARALLSSQYKRLDGYDMVRGLLPTFRDLQNQGAQLELVSADITEEATYLKIVSQRLTGEVKRGDVIRGGVILSTGEIGNKTVEIARFLERLVCTNGMTMSEKGDTFRRIHRGRRDTSDEFREYFSTEALIAEDRAIWLQARDVMAGFLQASAFESSLTTLRQATERPITGNVELAVEEVAKRFSLTDGERSDVLSNLARESELTAWSLSNSVTAVANTHTSYDRASQLEEIGGQIVNLNATEWNTIASRN